MANTLDSTTDVQPDDPEVVAELSRVLAFAASHRRDEIFGPLSQPMLAAVKAARQVIKGEALDDDLGDTETALASAFALAHADRLRYDHRRRGWMICHATTSIWRPDQQGEARRLAQSWTEQTMFDRVAGAASRKDVPAIRAAVRKTLSHRGIMNLIDLAQHQASVACAGDDWDPHPFALATADGQHVDLKTGAIRPLQPGDRVTRACAVPIDPAARCPRWRQFITEIADADAGIEALLRAVLGYSITGAIDEQIFVAAIGGGANGKSTLLEIVAFVLGDLAGVLPFGTLTRDRDSRAVQAEIADLPGTRFVRASEVREGVYLDEGRIKSLTGGDPINAARKFGHPFSFRPEFKLWLGLNHRPRVSDRSHGFWRRTVLIPFTRTFAGDKTLERMLRDEAPGILAWLVDACLDWQQHGIPRPAAAEAARTEWRDGEDLIAQWADMALVADPGGRVGAAEAFKAFTAWAATEGLSDRERPGRRAFGEWMASHFEGRKTNVGKVYPARLKVTSDASDGSIANLPSTRTHEKAFPESRHNPSLVTREGVPNAERL